MALPDTLVLLTTGTPELAQLKDDGSVNTIHALGSTAEAALSNAVLRANRCVSYRGARYALGMSSGSNMGVYKKSGAPAPTLVGMNSAGIPVGLFVTNTGSGAAGKQRLIAVGTNGGQIVYDYTDDGTTWAGPAAVGSAINAATGPGIVFSEKLYFHMASTGRAVAEFDLNAFTASRIVTPWLSTAPGSGTISAGFEVLDGTLYALALDSTPGSFLATRWTLYTWTGAGFSFNTQLSAANQASDQDKVSWGQCLLAKDPLQDKLIAFCNGSTNSTPANAGSQAYELTPSGAVFTVVDVTNTVIPVGLRPGARGSGDALSDRFQGMTVNDDDPTVAELFVVFVQGPAPGTASSIYKYTNPSTVLTLHVAGPGVDYALPGAHFGGGSRVDIGEGNQVTIEYDRPVPTGWEIGFRVESVVAGQNMGVFVSQKKETPKVQANLVSQTGSGGLAANRVTGVTGDAGATLRTVVVDLAGSGIPKGTGVHYKLDLQP